MHLIKWGMLLVGFLLLLVGCSICLPMLLFNFAWVLWVYCLYSLCVGSLVFEDGFVDVVAYYCCTGCCAWCWLLVTFVVF